MYVRIPFHNLYIISNQFFKISRINTRKIIDIKSARPINTKNV
jgi:hypothetical protein